MNREQILTATDEELNSLCATEIWKWRLEQGANYKDGSVAFPSVWRNTDDVSTFCQWDYIPTDNIEQAVELLHTLRYKCGLPNFDWLIGTCYNRMVFRVQITHTEALPHFAFTHEDESLTRAIVIACLLAVAEMESQP